VIKLEEWVDISRNTVRLALRRKQTPAYRRPEVSSKLDPYKDYLLARLAEFPELSVRPGKEWPRRSLTPRSGTYARPPRVSLTVRIGVTGAMLYSCALRASGGIGRRARFRV
jgi:hypothetical protein